MELGITTTSALQVPPPPRARMGGTPACRYYKASNHSRATLALYRPEIKGSGERDVTHGSPKTTYCTK
ncbi:hypothetical protein VZT92_007938 [Zoarces viviparus]|uniref:Uncharacterized protein n=1 Tax=Zoarces viviparus TaxID=48416 RepID=A0AAW1FMY5_ZOAVI